MEVGEDEVVGDALVVGEELAVLEDDADGLGSPPQPVSNIDAASGTASAAAEAFLTATKLTVSPTWCEPNAGMTTLGDASDTR